MDSVQQRVWIILYPSVLVCLVAVVVSDSLQPSGLCIAHQAPLSMGFSRQEHWSGMPCPPPGDLPNPGIKLVSSALTGFLPLARPGKPIRDLHKEDILSLK